MSGSSYDSNMISADHQDDQPAYAQSYQSLTHPHNDVDLKSLDTISGKIQNEDKPSHRTLGALDDSGHATVLTHINLKDELTHNAPNGVAATSSGSPQNLPEFPFSTARVWLSATIIMVIYIMVIVAMGPLTVQYLFSRFAEDHHYNITSTNKEPCSNSTDTEDASMANAQREASSTLLYAAIASSIPAFIICLFAGSISDCLGRKVLLLSTLSGAIIKAGMLCLIIKLKLDVQLIYFGSFVDGIVGSLFVTTLAITAIIADITPKAENKAVRFAIIEGIILVCAALAQLAVGYLIKAAGFFVPALICACLLFVSLLITIFILPETLRKKQLFTWNVGTHIKKTFRFYFSYGNTKGCKYQFIIGLAIHLSIMFANIGKSTIETIYVLNKPICWNSVEIGIFGAVRMVVMSLAAVVVLKMCKNRLSLEMTGIICGVSSVAGFILEGLANSTLMMYLSALAGILFTAAIPIPRAILSQIASPGEQGALFSSMSCMEAIASMGSSTLYTLIYNATLDTFRGAVFMATAIICFLSIPLFGMYRSIRLSNPNTYEQMEDDSVNTGTDYQSIRNKSENAGNV